MLLACLRSRATGNGLPFDRIDWTRFVRWALAHKVVPLVHEACRESGADGPPAELLDALEIYVERNQERSRRLAEELRDIVRELSLRGVLALPFKGPLLARQAYGDTALRQAGDLDILVRDEHVETFVALLRARGYQEDPDTAALSPAQHRAYRRYQSQYLYFRPSDGIVVEPHWRISPRPLAIELDHDALWTRSTEVDLAGQSVRSLGLEDLLIVLCVHGSKHQWVELRWICDLAALVQCHGGMDWPVVLRRAERQGCRRMLLLGLVLASDLLGAPLPALVRDRIAEAPGARRLAGQVCRRLFLEGNVTTNPFRLDRFRFLMRERWRDRLAYVTRSLTTARVEHDALLPFESPPLFLRSLAGLVHDYALLPAWLAGKSLRLPGFAGKDPESDSATKAAIREAWAERSAAWARRADRPRTPSDAKIDLALCAAAAVAPGHRVLDLASGVGEAAVTVARQLGGAGMVVASDLVADMVLQVRRRARAEACDSVFGCVADMEDLPFAEASFDAVVCRFGIMFSPQVATTLGEVRRVLKPGSRMALAVWGPVHDNTLFHILRRAVAPLGNPESEDEIGPFRFSAPGSLARRVRDAGFTEVRENELRIEDLAPEGGAFWTAELELLGGSWLGRLSPAARGALDASLEKEFAPYRTDSGYRLVRHVRIIFGGKPL